MHALINIPLSELTTKTGRCRSQVQTSPVNLLITKKANVHSEIIERDIFKAPLVLWVPGGVLLSFLVVK